MGDNEATSTTTPSAPSIIEQQPEPVAVAAPVQPGGLAAVFGETQEAINGRAAQLGFLAAIVTEVVTGQVSQKTLSIHLRLS